MQSTNKTDALLASIRNGAQMTMTEKLQLIVSLSVPSILAQITSVLMFFIDAAMVGHLGAEASASIGLMESTTWLMGSITNAAAMGFSVQVAHYIGGNDFVKARAVFRHGIVGTAIVSCSISIIALIIFPYLPYWLGGWCRHCSQRLALFPYLCPHRARLSVFRPVWQHAEVCRKYAGAQHC